MISKKIENANLISFEGKQLSTVLSDFIRMRKHIYELETLEKFDRQILNWFYEGILKE